MYICLKKISLDSFSLGRSHQILKKHIGLSKIRSSTYPTANFLLKKGLDQTLRYLFQFYVSPVTYLNPDLISLSCIGSFLKKLSLC